MSSFKKTPITDEERAVILRMHSEGYLLREIAAELRRGLPTIWYEINPDQKQYRSHPKFGLPKQTVVREYSPPSPEAIADRDRRLSLAPRDLTALVCGDPLPGCSALDRRANA